MHILRTWRKNLNTHVSAGCIVRITCWLEMGFQVWCCFKTLIQQNNQASAFFSVELEKPNQQIIDVEDNLKFIRGTRFSDVYRTTTFSTIPKVHSNEYNFKDLKPKSMSLFYNSNNRISTGHITTRTSCIQMVRYIVQLDQIWLTHIYSIRAKIKNDKQYCFPVLSCPVITHATLPFAAAWN